MPDPAIGTKNSEMRGMEPALKVLTFCWECRKCRKKKSTEEAMTRFLKTQRMFPHLGY